MRFFKKLSDLNFILFFILFCKFFPLLILFPIGSSWAMRWDHPQPEIPPPVNNYRPLNLSELKNFASFAAGTGHFSVASYSISSDSGSEEGVNRSPLLSPRDMRKKLINCLVNLLKFIQKFPRNTLRKKIL